MLRSPRGMPDPTYATLFGLLAVTGLRVGETLALDDDVDTSEAVLLVRHAKHGRNRIIPVARCTADRLAEYRSLRDRVLSAPATRRSSSGRRGSESGWQPQRATSPG